MWRNEILVALNDVLVQCETNARHFRYSAEAIGDQAVSGLLNRTAAEREGQAEQLRHHLIQLHDLPDTADPERDTWLELGDRLMARFAATGIASLLRERIEDEERLAATVTHALDLPVPGDLRPLLERLREQTRATTQALRERMSSLG